MVTKMKQLILIAFGFLNLLLLVDSQQSLPDKWWEKNKSKSIINFDLYINSMNEEYKDKFVIIDFYQKWCHWCYLFIDDYNRIIDDFTSWYGDQIVFLKVDGDEVFQIPMFYQVGEYPFFISIKPNTGTNMASRFRYNPRNYNTMKKWILEVLGDTPRLTIQKQPGINDEQQLKKFYDDVHSVMSDPFVKISDT